MMHPIELQAHRYNTEAFINADPVTLTLVRTTQSRSAAGGVVRSSVSLPAAIFRLLPQTGEVKNAETDDGSAAHPVVVVLGRWDSNMQEGDAFIFRGDEYTIVGPILPLHTDEAYERKGVAVYRG